MIALPNAIKTIFDLKIDIKNGYKNPSLFTATCNGQCTFPADLHGLWISSDVGQLTFSVNTVHNYPIVIGDVKHMDFTCYKKDGLKYIVK